MLGFAGFLGSGPQPAGPGRVYGNVGAPVEEAGVFVGGVVGAAAEDDEEVVAVGFLRVRTRLRRGR